MNLKDLLLQKLAKASQGFIAARNKLRERMGDTFTSVVDLYMICSLFTLVVMLALTFFGGSGNSSIFNTLAWVGISILAAVLWPLTVVMVFIISGINFSW